MAPISEVEIMCQAIALAFSKMQKPDLRPNADGRDLSKVFFDAASFERMAAAVKELSGGAVAMQKPEAQDQFDLEVMGQAKRLVLVGQGRRQRVTFIPPKNFHFDKQTN